MSELNARQQAFVEQYVVDHNATQAAIRAGYAESGAHTTGYRLLKNEDVQAAVAERESNLADEIGITKQWLLTKLQEIVNESMKPTPKTFHGGVVQVEDENGQRHTVFEIDAASANRAIETLMKHRGMFTERHQVEHSGTVYTLDLGNELEETEGEE